jgi:hypothetical protein
MKFLRKVAAITHSLSWLFRPPWHIFSLLSRKVSSMDLNSGLPAGPTSRIFYVILTILCCGNSVSTIAQPDDPDIDSTALPEALSGISRIEYDFPLYDYPFNDIGSYSFPSMTQSLSLSKNLTQAIHYGLASYGFSPGGDRRLKQRIWSFGLMASEFFLIYLPGGYSWQHEEWHRAVLKNQGIDSYDGVYDFRLLSSTIAVSRVGDDDLIRFKRDHPIDMIRLAEAGNESQVELVRSLGRELFFNRSDCSLDWITLLSNTFQTASYITICSMPYADRVTREMEREDGRDITKRDILGMDFTAWVYDLYRSDEPYTARGDHPSGVGVDRYIKHSELSKEESDYLLLQGILCWLNIFNPRLFMVNRFDHTSADSSTTLYWNAAVVHHLTPFGFAVDGDVLLKIRDWNISATLHSFMNRHSYFPGIALGIDDLPIKLGNARLYASAIVDAWFQPEGLRFESRKAEPGIAGSAGIKAAVTDNVLVYAEAYGKTAGWKAGAVSLSQEYGWRTGLSLWIPHQRLGNEKRLIVK